MKATVIVLLSFAMAQMAYGAPNVKAFVNGNELLEGCQAGDPICAGYIIGVADATEMVALHLTNICRPYGATTQQIADVLIQWLEGHPEERHRPAAKLAGLAMAEAWPCN